MVSGAVIIETPLKSRRYTCNSGVAITKGDLLNLLDPNTCSGTSLSFGDPFAGIAAMDKSATDGSTQISAYTDGIFDLVAHSPINVGQLCLLSGTNAISGAGLLTEIIKGAIVGKALEAATNGEVIRVAVGDII